MDKITRPHWVGRGLAIALTWGLWLGPLSAALALPAPAGADAVPPSALFPAAPAPAAPVSLPLAELVPALATADVIYLGEIHDRPADHAAQLALLQALHAQNPHLAIALEMFQQPYQSALDAYSAGDIGLTELRQRSEYDTRWGYPWAYYAPILEFGRRQRVPLVALNAPTEAVRAVGRKGLAALDPANFPSVPPVADMDLQRPAYRSLLRRIYDDLHQGHGSSRGFDTFFQAQVLWDETMAAAIATLYAQQRDRQIVVLAGQGHVVYGYGIPAGVARRQPEVRQATVLLSPATGWAVAAGESRGAIADFQLQPDPYPP